MTAVRALLSRAVEEVMLTSSPKQDDFLTRNREIQRRSRARRKDYIADLEKRVWQYQREGVKATAEVQAAARKVAEENYLLHSLLAKHGISTEEIKEHLQGNRPASLHLDSNAVEMATRTGQPQNHNGSQSRQPFAQAGQAPPRPAAPTTRQIDGGLGLPSPPSTGKSLGDNTIPILNVVNNPRPDQTPLSPMGSEPLHSASSFEVPKELPKGCHACEQEAASKGADETACEDAARIIASMRGQDDPEQVWPELGCSTTKSCMVKNMTIFQMVDGNN
jgi:hypothetical protein